MFKTIPEDYIAAEYDFNIPFGIKPIRIDKYLTNSIVNISRSRVQHAIDADFVTVNGKSTKASYKLNPGDVINVTLYKPPPIALIPQDIPLNVIYEDADILVINKQAGIVSHPGFGNRSGTIINAVLWHLGVREKINIELPDEDDDEDSDSEIDDEGKIFASDGVRPGLVHRLDKDTTGLMVISKTPEALTTLQHAFAERRVRKEYYALAWGNFKEDSGTITGNIGRSERNRKKFDIVKKGGRPSITDYEVIERFKDLTLLRVHLRTGRTHQIRVHFSCNNHPLFGDVLYCGDRVVFGGESPRRKQLYQKLLSSISRQMLHAGILSFRHPRTDELLEFKADPPQDMLGVISAIRNAEMI